MLTAPRTLLAASAFLLSSGPAFAADGQQYFARHVVSMPSSSASTPEVSGAWAAGEWFDNGICRADHFQSQRREYTCIGPDGAVLPDSDCSGPEPSAETQKVSCTPKIVCVMNPSKSLPAGKVEVLGVMGVDVARDICAEKVKQSKYPGICSRDGTATWRFHEGLGVYSGMSGYVNLTCDAW